MLAYTAGIIGVPLGGRRGDRQKRAGHGHMFLDGGLMLVSFVLLCLVKENRAAAGAP